MGDDWVSHVVLSLLEELRKQVPGTEMLKIGCVGAPELETRVAEGTVTNVSLRLVLRMLVRDGSGAEQELRGEARLTGPDPRTVALDLADRPEQQMLAVLREARRLVSRSGNDFAWSSWQDAADAVGEIDELIARLELRPVRASEIAGIFAPTGPMHELAVSSGWSQAFGDLADRFDAIRMVARDTWSCRACDADAGTIELRENGDLRLESFTGVLTRKLTEPGPFGRLWDAIAAGDAAAVFAVDPELAPWWCPACPACYCGEHWTPRCPRGHERRLQY